MDLEKICISNMLYYVNQKGQSKSIFNEVRKPNRGLKI